MILFFRVSKSGRYRTRGQWISRVLGWFPSLCNRHAVIFSVFLSNGANLHDRPPRDCLLKVSRPASFVAALALTHRFCRLSSVHGRSIYYYTMYIIHLRMRSHIPRHYRFTILIGTFSEAADVIIWSRIDFWKNQWNPKTMIFYVINHYTLWHNVLK